jgi:hypothetical protein
VNESTVLKLKFTAAIGAEFFNTKLTLRKHSHQLFFNLSSSISVNTRSLKSNISQPVEKLIFIPGPAFLLPAELIDTSNEFSYKEIAAELMTYLSNLDYHKNRYLNRQEARVLLGCKGFPYSHLSALTLT